MKAKKVLLLIGFLALMLLTCRKEKDDPAGGNKIEMGDNVIDSVSYFFTEVETGVLILGGNEIIQHGHCWNTETNPTIEGNNTILGNLTSEINFISVIDSLEDNTVYYIRPYIQTAYVVVYGEEEQIKTLKTGKPVVLTNPVSDITLTSALSGGIVTRDSGLFVTARGVCWDTTEIFRIDSCLGFTIDSLGLGSFSSEVTGLHEGTTYHLAAFATNEKGTGYGQIITFSIVPITPPVVTTSGITNITTTTAECGGNVTSDGNGSVTLKGVCWDTLATLTFENNIGHTEDGSGLGEFTSNITNLHEGKTYYVVAYATNEKGTGYGEIKSFTSLILTLPTITTLEVTNIEAYSAVTGGNVTNNGNGNVTARGVCWNISVNPTLQNCINFTSNGNGLGSFTSNITGLNPNTTHYVRAYATNSIGTAYGNQVNFITLYKNTCPGIPVVNYESQTYNTVQIGSQCWFRENLNVGTMISGTTGQTNNGLKEKYCYNNIPYNCEVYGGLYLWDEMMQYTTVEGVKGICPDNWHIPTYGEFNVLIGFLGGESVAGGKMKETGTLHWWSPNTGATNLSGFKALPGGVAANNTFYNLGQYSIFMSSTEYTGGGSTWNLELRYNSASVFVDHWSDDQGFSVRCLKD